MDLVATRVNDDVPTTTLGDIGQSSGVMAPGIEFATAAERDGARILGFVLPRL